MLPHFKRTPNYWCTWNTQNDLSHQKFAEAPATLAFAGDQGAKLARAMINEDILFGTDGLALQFSEFCSGLNLMLDDGWDVPYGIHPDTRKECFSSLILDAERFPTFTGTPAQRLKKLNQKVQSIGFQGIGLWTACQNYLETDDGPRSSPAEQKQFWTERLTWCLEAGVHYLKVDWGARCNDADYRRRLTETAASLSPDLIIEHAFPCAPVNDVNTSNRFLHWNQIKERFLETASFSQIFRIYDTAPQLSVPTTIDRCSVMLSELPDDSGCLLNCEDELYVGTGLGLAIAAMRSSLVKYQSDRSDPKQTRKRIKELARCLGWFTLAQPFSNKESLESYILTSDLVLWDTWTFNPGDFWWDSLNYKPITQGAPAVISRNMPLPSVIPMETPPYVLCCCYPNGATAISFLARQLQSNNYLPLCNATITVSSMFSPVGIFGRFQSLTICFPEDLEGLRLFARDLALDIEVDITAMVIFRGNSLVLPGTAAQEICPFSDQDVSEPGFVIHL